jgi:hypothetical protein
MTPRAHGPRYSLIPLCASVLALALTLGDFVAPRSAGAGGAPTTGPSVTVLGQKEVTLNSDAKLPGFFSAENTGASFPPPTFSTMENAIPIAPFPDPFAWASDPLGKTRSTDFKDWAHHRAEMMAMIEHYEIGTKPPVDIAKQVTATFTPANNGGTLAVKVTVKDQSLTLTCRVGIPAGAKAPYPVVIGMNSPSGGMPANAFSTRGIATVTYSHNDVTTYNSASARDPFFRLYPEQTFSSQQAKGNTGQYAAWAWGVSRIIDGFTLVKDQFPVDMDHIAVTGCSYAGKMALFAGAFDERIALTIAQESGGGGATNWRYSNTERQGSVEGIGNTNHSWFASQMFSYAGANLPKLPEDHHMLTSLCAPRALYVTGNTDFEWLSNPSCYVNAKATQKVYATLGVADRFGFCVDGGHGHCQVPNSQLPDINYFLDRFMLGKTELSKIVATAPANYARIDADRWTQWWGTGTADLPPAK